MPDEMRLPARSILAVWLACAAFGWLVFYLLYLLLKWLVGLLSGGMVA